MVTESHHFLSFNFRFLVCVYICLCLFTLFMSPFLLLLTYYLSLLGLLFILFLYCFTPFFENMRIQNTENSEKENSEIKKKKYKQKEKWTKIKHSYNMTDYRRSPPKVFLGNGVLKICSKLTGEHPCESLISIKLQPYWIHTSAWVFSYKFAT